MSADRGLIHFLICRSMAPFWLFVTFLNGDSATNAFFTSNLFNIMKEADSILRFLAPKYE
jgi:hypothetical protein